MLMYGIIPYIMTHEINKTSQNQEFVPKVSPGERPIEELIAERDDVSAALEWGFETKDPTVEKLHIALMTSPKEAGRLLVLTPQYKPGTDHAVVIRETSYDENVLNVLKSAQAVHLKANTNWFNRAVYDETIAISKGIQRGNQGRAVAKNTVYSIGDAALLGGAPLANNVLQLVAYQADFMTAAGAAGLGLGVGVVKGIHEALRLHGKHQDQLKKVINPAIPVDAEALFKRLLPLFEQAARLIDGNETSPTDVKVLDRVYTMDFDHVEEMLKKEGGPKYSDYEAVLHDLKVQAKATMDRSRYPARHEEKPKKFDFNPAQLVGQMVVESKGEVWTDTFVGRVSDVYDAQKALEEKRQALEALRADTNRTPGTGGKKREESLEEDAKRLEDTIDLRMLQLFKLNAERIKVEVAEQMPEVTDPYEDKDALETSGEPKEPSRAEQPANPYVAGEDWPLLGQEKPEKR